MADNKKTPAALLDDLAVLDPAQRCEVAETFAEVPDGRHTAHMIGMLAHFLDPS